MVLCRECSAKVLEELRPRLGSARGGRFSKREQVSSQVGLRVGQALPEAVPASDGEGLPAERSPGSVPRFAAEDAAKKLEQRPGANDEARKDIGEQDGEGAPATGPTPTVRAEEPASADDPLLGTLSVAPNEPVSDQGLDAAAVRALAEFRPLEALVEFGFGVNESLG